ncbi:WxL domain-containing protein [Latilactobacillus graminis]|uniref:WxL domain-containing protein n=2 Tax=Latilactobacillus graminis TaxID=60519 RepID=A0AA89KY89_9LACO|nr:WxL domain-containing protein [Latilactobacillus graminis]KRM24135.1 hypothetical protein FC90_GL000609 [Latilactobacillus graminis DSM 20719]QFP78877.1 hypothetical protein LG542_00820 [Latilactobacillus graminis]
MKQSKFVLLAAVTLASTTLMNVAVAQAAVESGSGVAATADQAAEATTTAEFSVKAGQLTLDAAPDFNFGETSMQAIIKGDALKQVDNKVSGTHDDSHNADGSIDKAAVDTLQVSDYRGAGNHWTLSANMSQFTNATTKTAVGGVITLGGSQLGLNAKTISTNASADLLTSAAAAAASEKNVEGLSTVSDTLAAGSTLKLNTADLKNIQAGTYNAAITWTLSDGIASEVAAG